MMFRFTKIYDLRADIRSPYFVTANTVTQIEILRAYFFASQRYEWFVLVSIKCNNNWSYGAFISFTDRANAYIFRKMTNCPRDFDWFLHETWAIRPWRYSERCCKYASSNYQFLSRFLKVFNVLNLKLKKCLVALSGVPQLAQVSWKSTEISRRSGTGVKCSQSVIISIPSIISRTKYQKQIFHRT